MRLFVYRLIFVLLLIIDNIYGAEPVEKDNNDEPNIFMLDNSRYHTSVNVPKEYFGAILERYSTTNNTSTHIQIPRKGEAADGISILGSTQRDVAAASQDIRRIACVARKKKNVTHFISIPMNSPEIIQSFQAFKIAVLRECAGSRGIDETIFINPYKLHITMGVMCLIDDQEIGRVSQLLIDARDKIVLPLFQGHLPLKIRLKGLSYFSKGGPSQMNILYGTVHEEGDAKGLIQQVADGLVDYFIKAGYMQRERSNVTLHVTFMNTLFRKPSRRPNKFNGTEVLQKFSDYDFGVMDLKDIHLSDASSKGADGYYKSCMIASIAS